jgi:hypothetical protein
MAASAQRIADLTARFAELEEQAFTLKTLSEMCLERAGYGSGHRAGPGQPRRLQAVEGGRR